MNRTSLATRILKLFESRTTLSTKYYPFVAYQRDISSMITGFPAVAILPDMLIDSDIDNMRYRQRVEMLFIESGDVVDRGNDYERMALPIDDLHKVLNKLMEIENILAYESLKIEIVDKHYHAMNKFTCRATFDVVFYDYSKI